MDDCIFCKIIAGKVPCDKVYEDASTIAFLDISPASLGHTLVMPKDHCETFDEMQESKVKSLALTVQKIARAIKKISKGYNLIQNNKKIAGQIVPHVHFHLVPRNENDWIEWKRPFQKYSDAETKRFLGKIKTLLK